MLLLATALPLRSAVLLRRICSTVIAVTVVAVAACGSSGPSLPRTYTNPSLGISVRYPADWHLSAQVYKRVSGYIVFFTDNRTVGVVLRPTAVLSRRFANANESDMPVSFTARRVLHRRFVTVGGLRFAEVEFLSLDGSHCLALDSGIGPESQPGSVLYIDVDCPVGRWPAERATLIAILDSLRISKPS
jgi:hypothetical protein